jgi:hypothetical protein
MKLEDISMFDTVSYLHPISKKWVSGKVVCVNNDTDEVLVSVNGSYTSWFRSLDLMKLP